MKPSYFLFTGSLGALISVLAHSVLYSALELLRMPKLQSTLTLVQVTIAEMLLHLLSGIGMGLLFWLSWGLAAVVTVEWWWRGVMFGTVCGLGLVLPALGTLALTRQAPLAQNLAVSARWFTTCLLVGLACAWQYAKGP